MRKIVLLSYISLLLQPAYANAAESLNNEINDKFKQVKDGIKVATPELNNKPATAENPLPVSANPADEKPEVLKTLGGPAMVSENSKIDPKLKTVVGSSPTIPKNKDIVPPEFNRSLMFRQDDINKVRMVYKVYLDRIKNAREPIKGEESHVKDLLDKLGTGPAPALPEAPAGIYLNSIMYRGVGNAVAFINNKKYETGTDMDNIKLVSLTSNTAEIEWHITNLKDMDINVWSTEYPREISKDDEDQVPVSRRGIKVDSATKTVHFTLKPNQYLDLQSKSVREGRPKPVVKPSQDVSKAVEMLKGLPGVGNSEPNAVPGQKSESGGNKQMSFKANDQGHYDIPVGINSGTLIFRYDTGAGYPVISRDDAKKVGIDPNKLDFTKYQAKVANGAIVQSAKIENITMRIGDMVFEHVDIMIADGVFPQALLGASFVNRQDINLSMGNNTLLITQVKEADGPAKPEEEAPLTQPLIDAPQAAPVPVPMPEPTIPLKSIKDIKLP